MFFFLPIGIDRKTSRVPVITYALLAVNIGVFLWLLPLDHRSVMSAFGLVPASPSIFNILTSMFAHAGFFHLAWNMLFLWLFGPSVENALGRLEYAIFYFGSGFAASLLHVVITYNFTPSASHVPMVGASGAIAGILGIFAIRYFRTRIKVFWCVGILVIPIRWGAFTVPAMLGLGIWFVRQLIGGVASISYPESGGVAYWSHIGGMIFGMMLAHFMALGREASKEYLLEDAQSHIVNGATWNAAENFRAFLEHDPENAEIHGELARVFATQGDVDLAVSHFHRCIEGHLKLQQSDKALTRYSQLKYYCPRTRLSLEVEYQLAKLLAEQGNAEIAAKMFDQIASLHPGAPEAEVSLMKAGELYLALGNKQRSRQCCDQFFINYPHSGYCPRVLKIRSLAEKR